VRIEPSRPPGDAPCPNCGHLLWFPPPGLSEAVKEVVADRASKRIIQKWTDQVARCPDDRYFDELISGLVRFMGATRGAIWVVGGVRLKMKSRYQCAEFPETPSDRERSNRLVQEVAAMHRSMASEPSPKDLSCEDASVTSDSPLLAVPIRWKTRVIAVVEVAHAPGGTTDLQRRNLRFLEYVCELTSDRIGRLVDADSISDTATATEAAAPAPSAAAVGTKRWWEVWKK
jgi:hypothetical protein